MQKHACKIQHSFVTTIFRKLESKYNMLNLIISIYAKSTATILMVKN